MVLKGVQPVNYTGESFIFDTGIRNLWRLSFCVRRKHPRFRRVWSAASESVVHQNSHIETIQIELQFPSLQFSLYAPGDGPHRQVVSRLQGYRL